MGKSIIVLACLSWALVARTQDLRTSPMQYQFNQLSLNPAYAARLPHPAFDATYFGNFTSDSQVSRSVFVNALGPVRTGGIGGTLQFYQTFFYGEMNLRPSYARRFELANGTQVAFGASFGFNYFDIDESVISSIQSDFISIDGGLGVFFHRNHSYIGLSALNLFETSFGYEANGTTGGLDRESPYTLSAGTLFRIADGVHLKPALWLRYINQFELPVSSFKADDHDVSADLLLSAVVEGTYVVGLLYGQRQTGNGSNVEHLGVSASFLLGNLRLTYAIQSNTSSLSGVSLPASHLLSLGYDFLPENEDEVLRFF